MTREQVQALVRRRITDAEWLDACRLLEFLERHPDAEAVFDRCADRGLSTEETIRELSKLPPPT